MRKKRTSKKALSILLILCMVVCFMPTMSITASAVANDSWVGTMMFDYDNDAFGDGWTWDGTSKILTLSGVDASNMGKTGIYIAAPATDTVTVILEGANKTTTNAMGKCGLDCSGSLIIKGSGTLEASSITGIFAVGIFATHDLTIESGYITASGVLSGIYSGANLTVSGGYISATASGDTAGGGGIVSEGDYSQTGGYIKTVSNGIDPGLKAGKSNANATVTVSGGYLEAEGKYGIALQGTTTTFTNSGGVAKAIGKDTEPESRGIMAISAEFTDGVTIASGATRAIQATTVSGDETYWLANAANGVGTALNDSTTPVNDESLKSIIIANEAYNETKTATSDDRDLDGTYISVTSGSGYVISALNLAVAGGSYVETSAAAAAISLTNSNMSGGSTGTLVGVNTASSDSSAGGIDIQSGSVKSEVQLIGTAKAMEATAVNSTCSRDAVNIIGVHTGTSGYGVKVAKATAGGKIIGISKSGTGITITDTFTGGTVTGYTGSGSSAGIMAADAINAANIIDPNANISGVNTAISPTDNARAIVLKEGSIIADGVVAAYHPGTVKGAVICSDDSAPTTTGMTIKSGTTLGGPYNGSSTTDNVVYITKAAGSVPLTFADNASYDVPAGHTGVSYTATTAFTATGGTAPYSFTIEPAVSGVSINNDNKLVYTRATVAVDTTATIKVTDSASPAASATIEIAIGAVTNASALGAAVADVTIDGYKDEAITEQDVTINLTGLTFEALTQDADVTSWFTGLATGLSAAVKTAVSAGDTSLTITISGTPTVTSSATLAINIPDASISASEEVSVAANANAKFNITTAPDSWVGDVRFNYADANAGSAAQGWTWDGTSKTLTLSGVNITTYLDKASVKIAGDATIVLEGANKITGDVNNTNYGIDCRSALIMKGSGTLEIEIPYNGGYAIHGEQTGTLTVESGYINAFATHSYRGGGVRCKSVTVNGGYLYAKGGAEGISASAQDWSSTAINYTQTGGYVKSVAVNPAQYKYGLIVNGKMSVTGGYLEVSGSTGIKNGDFTNSGGVVKATGSYDNGIEAATAEFTGGVTIASGTAKAIVGTTATGTDDQLEKVWTLTDGVASNESTIGTSIDSTSVVIAKAVAAPATEGNVITLDSVYIYSASTAALDTAHTVDTRTEYYDVTVTGGSYLETGINTKAALLADTITVDKTLVCISKNNAVGQTFPVIGAKSIDVASGATLYGFSASNFAIMVEAADAEIKNAGNLIGESNGASIMTTGSLNVTGGHVCGISHGSSEGAGIFANIITATGGYITSVGKVAGMLVMQSFDCGLNAIATAVGASNGAYSLPAIVSGTGEAIVKGTKTAYSALHNVSYGSYNDGSDDIVSYFDGTASAGTIAKVLLIKGTEAPPPPPPIPSSGGGSSAITVPASSDEGSVNVEAKVSGGKATITITDTQLDKIISDTKDTGIVKVNTSSLKVEEAVIPAKLVEAAANATGSEGLEVELAAGTVALDIKALKNIGDENITVSVEKVKVSELTAAQKTALGDNADTAIVVDVNILVNGVKKSNFGGGTITVGIPYTAKAGEDTSKLTVWYISDSGTMEKMGGKYDAKAKMFVFETTHLSKYVLVSEANAVTNPFVDVANTAYYYDAVMWASDKGVTQGTTATTFSPSTTCTRAQMVTFLWRAMGSPEPTMTANPFTDVTANAYYYKAVMWAAEKNITEGTSATTFSPNATVTRGQVVTLEWRTAGKPAATVTNPFTDVAKGAYYEDAVMWAVDKKITEGTSSTTFSPADGCTRAQIVTFLFRYLGK